MDTSISASYLDTVAEHTNNEHKYSNNKMLTFCMSVLLSACLSNSYYLGLVKLVLLVNSGAKDVGAGSSGEKETVKFTMDVHNAFVSDHLHVIYLV